MASSPVTQTYNVVCEDSACSRGCTKWTATSGRCSPGTSPSWISSITTIASGGTTASWQLYQDSAAAQACPLGHLIPTCNLTLTLDGACHTFVTCSGGLIGSYSSTPQVPLPGWAIALIVVFGALLPLAIIGAAVYCCCCRNKPRFVVPPSAPPAMGAPVVLPPGAGAYYAAVPPGMQQIQPPYYAAPQQQQQQQQQQQSAFYGQQQYYAAAPAPVYGGAPQPAYPQAYLQPYAQPPPAMPAFAQPFVGSGGGGSGGGGAMAPAYPAPQKYY